MHESSLPIVDPAVALFLTRSTEESLKLKWSAVGFYE